MKIKTILLVILLCLAPHLAAADESVINLIENPIAEYAFAEGSSILEIVFPRVHSSDCAILRIDDQVMMIDASTPGAKMQARIKSALEAMNVTHVDIAFNTHPHNDHIGGFSSVYETAPFDVIQVAFPEDFNKCMVDALEFARANNVEIQHVHDGDTLTLGEAGQVAMHVIQRDGVKWSENDQSAMLMIIYGERSILFSADIENHAQADYAAIPPSCGIDADILKYPHHGIVRMNSGFLMQFRRKSFSQTAVWILAEVDAII